MAQILQPPLLFDAIPQRSLAFVPAVAGVIMWVCLIMAIVRWMRRPIVLLGGELGLRHGGAGGEAAAGGSWRCSRICAGPRCLPGSPARQQVRGNACLGGEVAFAHCRARGPCEQQQQGKGCEADCALIMSNCTGLVFGVSRAWHEANHFVLLWNPACVEFL